MLYAKSYHQVLLIIFSLENSVVNLMIVEKAVVMFHFSTNMYEPWDLDSFSSNKVNRYNFRIDCNNELVVTFYHIGI
jgi:hypothetical protein